MIEKWYRGHQGDRQAIDNFGIIWLADDPDYAQEYANEYPNGIVSTIFVDMDKIKELDWYYDEDFDPYDPDMNLVRDYMSEQGGNAYTFTVNDGTTVLALLSTEPIVKIERKINENKKHYKMKIKLSESRLKQIVAESVKKVLNESGYDSYPQSGYEEFTRIGVNAAYNIYRQLRDNVHKGHYDSLDGECIQRIIDGFEDKLWALVEHGEFDEYEAKYRHPLGVSKDEYIKDVEDGKYNN